MLGTYVVLLQVVLFVEDVIVVVADVGVKSEYWKINSFL